MVVQQGMYALKKITMGALMAVFAGCAYFAWAMLQVTGKPQPFDAVTWRQSSLLDKSNDPGCFRGGMALDLINYKKLLGMSDPEVISLLGAPSSSSSGTWLYPVGQCGLLWEQHELQVTFGSNSKVTHASLKNSI
jgi:hypothetical protein